VTTVEARDVGYVVDGRTIFDGVNLRVSSGEAIAVLGPSGAGKTSLLAILAGLAQPTSGQVLVDGEPLRSALPKGFVLVLQGYGLMSLLTARENIEVALRAQGRRPSLARATAATWLAEVGLKEHGSHLVEDLSGGQQQRVAVARALALEPVVVIADEPTAEQDSLARALVMRKLLDVTLGGGILVLATHDAAVAELCTNSVRLHEAAASA
jgi:putative ABC transport system ATP-binding protein